MGWLVVWLVVSGIAGRSDTTIDATQMIVTRMTSCTRAQEQEAEKGKRVQSNIRKVYACYGIDRYSARGYHGSVMREIKFVFPALYSLYGMGRP